MRTLDLFKQKNASFYCGHCTCMAGLEKIINWKSLILSFILCSLNNELKRDLRSMILFTGYVKCPAMMLYFLRLRLE